MLPSWCANTDLKVSGVLKKLEQMIDRPVDLLAHIMEIVPKAHEDMTVGETLKLLPSNMSQCSGSISLDDVVAEITG